MKADGAFRHILLALVLAVICYAFFYRNIENRRIRKGPWQVTFTANTNQEALLVINQSKLAITNVQICFSGQPLPASNVSTTMVFNVPQPVPYEVPFGKCLFMDTTFLPGTVTFSLFGHEVELLGRVLVIDRQEHPWVSESAITLHPLPAQTQ